MVRALNVIFLIWSTYSKTDFASIGWAIIESIIDGENGDKEKGYENAGEVLKKGFLLFTNDSKFEKYAGTISQTLARLHSKWKHFDEAVEWAKQSLELAYKDNRCYFLHTYGNILKEQFQHLRDKKLKKPPNNKVPAAAGSRASVCEIVPAYFSNFESFVKSKNPSFRTSPAFSLSPFSPSIMLSMSGEKFVCFSSSFTFLRFNI
jgi:hypothetical protein